MEFRWLVFFPVQKELLVGVVAGVGREVFRMAPTVHFTLIVFLIVSLNRLFLPVSYRTKWDQMLAAKWAQKRAKGAQ